MHVLAQLFVMESTPQEEGVSDGIREARAKIMRQFQGGNSADVGYNEQEDYGMSNDNVGSSTSDEPLPYLPPTTEVDGMFPGLDPPME